MFAPYCKTHGSRVLLPLSSISAIVREGGASHRLVLLHLRIGWVMAVGRQSLSQNTSGHHGGLVVRNSRCSSVTASASPSMRPAAAMVRALPPPR